MESQTLNPQRNSIADPQIELHSSINDESLDSTDPYLSFEDVDSSCSTPYVSAPSSPTRSPVSGFFYSAPASPMHFAITKNPSLSSSSSSMDNQYSSSFEFDFSSRFGSNAGSTSMSSADELFHDGKIRPMKLSTHLEFPLPPLLDLEIGDEEGDGIVEFVRGRDLRLRDKFQRRRTRSMSPLRNSPIEWREEENGGGSNVECSVTTEKEVSEESEVMEKVEGVASNSEASTPSISASSSRSSSSGRNSKRWVFLKDFLYRSKSEGRSNNNFWSNLSFTPVKEKKSGGTNQSITKQKFINPLVGRSSEGKKAKGTVGAKKNGVGKPANGVGKRRVPPSPHERHYTANRAYSEEMKKKTYLPYRQGLLGCLGFSSKGYGAVNGFTKALNSVSSR